METDVEVRLAVPEDCAAVVSLVAAYAAEDGHGAKPAIDRAAIEQAFRRCVEDPAHLILVAVQKGKGDGQDEGKPTIAGYTALHWIPFPMLGGTEAYLSDMIVASARRGAGIGRALADAAERVARERGCQRLMLNNRLTAESFARGFYAKLGYRARDDFQGFVKPLPPPATGGATGDPS
jgi:GNAT superfamily N-acetyltransferase